MVTKKRNPKGYAFLLWIGRLSGLDPRHVFVEELLDLDGAVAAEGVGNEGYAEDVISNSTYIPSLSASQRHNSSRKSMSLP